MKRPALGRRLQGFGTTIFSAITQRAIEKGAVNLAQGFPDFDGPEFVKEVAIAAIREGKNQYARSAGQPELCRAIADSYGKRAGLAYDPETEVTVTCGATEAIFATLQATCDVGDEVILFEPYYDSYRASVCAAGAMPRVVTLRAPDFSFDEAELRRAVSPRTRALVLNTPHNPTGRVFSREELEAVARVCVEGDLVCLSDEVYEHLVYEGRHVSVASLPGMRERTVTISSLGKTFSLTGWKVGWAAAPAELSAAVRAAHQFMTFATSPVLQLGAAAALAAPEAFFEELTREYRQRRDLLVSALGEAGFDVKPPEGTYFVCAGFGRFGFDDDVAFAKHMVDEIGVAVIPPSVFYDNPERGRSFVRFAFCKREATLLEAIGRLGRLRPACGASPEAPSTKPRSRGRPGSGRGGTDKSRGVCAGSSLGSAPDLCSDTLPFVA